MKLKKRRKMVDFNTLSIAADKLAKFTFVTQSNSMGRTIEEKKTKTFFSSVLATLNTNFKTFLIQCYYHLVLNIVDIGP